MGAWWRRVAMLLAVGCLAVRASPAQESEPAEAAEFHRPVDVAPTTQSIGGGYVLPVVQRPAPRPFWREYGDVVVMAAMLGLAAWVLHQRRSRNGLLILSLAALAYFGFYREGCVCPIGAIQNVAVAFTEPRYAIPLVVIAIFVLPLILSLFFGRVFCGSVCPLGAMQELSLIRPILVPRRLDRVLGLFKYVYLGVAIWAAAQPIETRDFLICRFDPFVSIFRRTGFFSIFLWGGAVLLIGLFIGRPYCRYLCPYGALLAITSRLSWRNVVPAQIKGHEGGLCPEVCPYGAIDEHRVSRAACVSCGRCYESCPREVQATKRARKPQLVALQTRGKP
ncbi:MAG: hypothetical protein AMXMBFR47_16450 [Planctomycetota bacterium]